MAINLLQILKDNFKDVDSLNLEKVRKMVLDTNAYFESLESALESGNSQIREEALGEAVAIIEFLDTQVSQLMVPSLDSLNSEEREMVMTMMEGLKLGRSTNNKIKIKKLKPIKLS